MCNYLPDKLRTCDLRLCQARVRIAAHRRVVKSLNFNLIQRAVRRLTARLLVQGSSFAFGGIVRILGAARLISNLTAHAVE